MTALSILTQRANNRHKSKKPPNFGSKAFILAAQTQAFWILTSPPLCWHTFQTPCLQSTRPVSPSLSIASTNNGSNKSGHLLSLKS
jgi:hypothetical protein